MVQKGVSEKDAYSKIWLVDSKGLIVKNRPRGGINHEKAPFAQEGEPIEDLLECVKHVKPTALIGCAAQGRMFNKEILELMTSLNERPVVFALSNPTVKAECTAEEAYNFTDVILKFLCKIVLFGFLKCFCYLREKLFLLVEALLIKLTIKENHFTQVRVTTATFSQPLACPQLPVK